MNYLMQSLHKKCPDVVFEFVGLRFQHSVWCCSIRSSDTLIVLKTCGFPVNILILRAERKIKTTLLFHDKLYCKTKIFFNCLREHAPLKLSG